MPKSLRCEIKHLCHNGTLTERKRDRILKALEQEDALDKIRAEIQSLRNCSCSCSDGIIDDVEDIIDKYREGGAE